MLYTDLVAKTTNLTIGQHTIYEIEGNRVVISNLGVAHPGRAQKDEYLLELFVNGRNMVPRHSDFFTDYQLKCEVRPDLHLQLSEACEHLCNGANPLELISSKRLPDFFAEPTNADWSLQTSMYQTAGLSTKLFLCGLQGLIRVQDLNDHNLKAPEAFRVAFVDLSKGKSLLDVVKPLHPQVTPGKRYFDGFIRKEKV
jgi:hypothetical protein